MGNPRRLAWSVVWRNRTILRYPHLVLIRWADSCAQCLQSLLWENLGESVRERLIVELKVHGRRKVFIQRRWGIHSVAQLAILSGLLFPMVQNHA